MKWRRRSRNLPLTEWHPGYVLFNQEVPDDFDPPSMSAFIPKTDDSIPGEGYPEEEL